ncbi:MAG: class I SAM-dependent methyltransferase, partial [Burkholderiaceae bacterium]
MTRADGARDVTASASAAYASTVRASADPLAFAECSVPRVGAANQAADADFAFRQLAMSAAARYRPAGRSSYYFARGKLGGDPVFAALLRDGRIRDDVRIVDVGCGLGILAAWLAAAEVCDPLSASEWPQTWAPPPKNWTLRGFDLRTRAIAAGQRALSDLGRRVAFNVGDVRGITLPACDVVVMFDVLHYMDRDAQQMLLKSAHKVLAPGDVLLLRVGDISSNWRSRFTSMVDWWVTL